MRRYFHCLVLAFLLLSLSAFAGGKKEATAGAPPWKTVGTNEFGWHIPEKTLEITFYDASMQQTPDYAKDTTEEIGAYILKKFNVKLIKVAYDMDPGGQQSLMLASNSYPEVIAGMSPNDAEKWVAQSRVKDVAPYLDAYGPTIKKKLAPYQKRLVDSEGHLYVMPQYWGMLPIPDQSAHIRWDWWQAMGAPKLETPDEYFQVIKKMQQLHPTNARGERTYGISGYDGFKDIFPVLSGFWGLKDGYKEGPDKNLTHWINTPEGLAMTKFMNRFSRDDLLDPDSFINTYEQWKAKFSDERIVGHVGAWWVTTDAGHETWAKSVPNWTEDMRYLPVKLKAAEAKQAYLSPKNTTGDTRTIVTDHCTQIENVLRWWDFEISDTGTRLVGWGIPNQPDSVCNFKDNTWSFTDQAVKAMLTSTFDYDHAEKALGQVTYVMVAGQGLMDDGKSTIWFDQNFNDQDKWRKLMNTSLRDTEYDFSAFLSVVFPPEDPATVTKKQVEDLLLTGWPEAVMAPTEAQCEQKFLALRDTLNKAGLKNLEAFLTKGYKQNLTAWGEQ
jgi:putative aldouronate transport system substrate-binding protein